MSAQGVLALYCQEPGCPVELTYRGYGRPPRWCDTHYPRRAPARLPRPERQHEVPAARRTDPETSHQAARKDNNRGLALLALVDHGPMHDFELAKVTGKAQTSIGVRRKELVSLGLVERAPVKPRPNEHGSPCIVWRVTEAGVAKAKELRG